MPKPTLVELASIRQTEISNRIAQRPSKPLFHNSNSQFQDSFVPPTGFPPSLRFGGQANRCYKLEKFHANKNHLVLQEFSCLIEASC